MTSLSCFELEVAYAQKFKNYKQRIDPTIVVALIGLAGTVIAALLASPLLESWLSPQPPNVTPDQPTSSASINTGTPSLGNAIGLNQTVQGTLYFDEPGVWIFNEGPATVTIVLDVGPFGDALLIVYDPSGVQRKYVEQLTPGVARLVSFQIPTEGDYTIFARNTKNEQVDYTLTVQDALTPSP